MSIDAYVHDFHIIYGPLLIARFFSLEIIPSHYDMKSYYTIAKMIPHIQNQRCTLSSFGRRQSIFVFIQHHKFHFTSFYIEFKPLTTMRNTSR